MTRKTTRIALLAATAAAGVAASPANAAIVQGNIPGSNQSTRIDFFAQAGETNDLKVTYTFNGTLFDKSDDFVIFEDPSNPVTKSVNGQNANPALWACYQINAHRVSCQADKVTGVRALLGDKNDKAEVLAPLVSYLYGFTGNDTLKGGPLTDYLYGGDDSDLLYGNNGNDSVHGENGNDWMRGHAGADTLFGGAGTDSASYSDRNGALTIDQDNAADDGEAGENDNVRDDIESIFGGTAGDKLTGHAGVNNLYGNAGDDELSGLGGTDGLYGGINNDKITGGTGVDTLSGQAGDDTLDSSGDAGVADTDHCGDGTDSAQADNTDLVSLTCEAINGANGNDVPEPNGGNEDAPVDTPPVAPPVPGDQGTPPPPPALLDQTGDTINFRPLRFAVVSRSVKVSRTGKLSLKVRCTGPAGQKCRGTLKLVRNGNTRLQKVVAMSAGRTVTLRLKLGPKARRSLKRAGRQRMSVVLRRNGVTLASSRVLFRR